MSDRDQVVAHLRAGHFLRLFLAEMSFPEGHRQVDGLEAHVGLPLIRREVIEAEGRFLIVRREGSQPSPIERQLERQSYGQSSSAAD